VVFADPAIRTAADQIGPHLSPSYEGLVTRYLTDVAADSGKTTNTYAVTSQYGPGATPDTQLRYRVTFSAADVLKPTDAYPPDAAHGNQSGCVAPGSVRDPSDPLYTWCLTDAQIQDELSSIVRTNGLPTGVGPIYFVMLPPGVDVCATRGSEQPHGVNPCADTDFCGYHSSTASGMVYAVVPYAGVSGCESGEAPNGDPAADSAISLLSHEHNDAITDPLLGSASGGGWYEDSNDVEVSDKCAQPYVYGAVVRGTSFNQVINGHPYYVQDEFANADGANPSFDGCEQRPGAANDGVSPSADATPLAYHGGPVLTADTPYLIFWDPQLLSIVASSTAPRIGQSVTFTAALQGGPPGTVYAWDFGDGTAVSSSAPSVAHAYGAPGRRTVTVTAAGQTATLQVHVLTGPTASFTVPRGAVPPGRPIRFDASPSRDPDGRIIGWRWRFGDGTGAARRAVAHAYLAPGTYTVSLTVTDSNGLRATWGARVLVGRLAARIAAHGIPALVAMPGALLLRTGRWLRCTVREGSCTASARAFVRVAGAYRWIGTVNETVGARTAIPVEIPINLLGRRLARAQRGVAVRVKLSVRAKGAVTLRVNFTVRVR
jgi:hypothetical protein